MKAGVTPLFLVGRVSLKHTEVIRQINQENSSVVSEPTYPELKT